jgi:hypothetical protein
MRIRINGRKTGHQFQVAVENVGKRLIEAIQAETRETALRIRARGRQSIAGAGNFGSRWTQGLTVEAFGTRKGSLIKVGHQIPYARVHEFGKIIKGKPLLWIPVAPEAKGIRARDYPGRLFRVKGREGKTPLLMSAGDRRVKYIGAASVTLKPRFGLRAIARDEAGHMGRRIMQRFT